MATRNTGNGKRNHDNRQAFIFYRSHDAAHPRTSTGKVDDSKISTLIKLEGSQ
jgi:hypothetical protein